jgi:hypothetical protein
MVYQTVLHHVTGHAVFAVLVTERLAVGVIVVVTLEVLFHVLESIVVDVIVPVFISEPDVAMTVHVMVTVHVHQLATLPTFHVNTFPEKVHVDAVNHVNHDGSVSEIATPDAVFGQLFP